MADPSIIATLVGGIVSAFTAYVGYRTSVDTAKAKGEPAPEKSKEATAGEQAAQVVETGIQTYGQQDAQTALAGFQHNPQLFAPVLQQVLVQIAERSPAFLAQLQGLTQQAGIQPAVHGTVNVSGHGRTYGVTAGVITGSVTGSPISINEDGDDERPERSSKPPQGGE
jgi:hypothetical protein